MFLKKVNTNFAVFPEAGFREDGRWMDGVVAGSAPSGALRNREADSVTVTWP